MFNEPMNDGMLVMIHTAL